MTVPIYPLVNNKTVVLLKIRRVLIVFSNSNPELSGWSIVNLWQGVNSMSTDLNGKVALVTGATSGIGRATAVMFAQAGAKVVLAGRRVNEGEAAVEEIESSGGTACFVQADVSKATEVESLLDKAIITYGKLDIAFNNAGVEGDWVPITEQTEESWDHVIDINLKGVWLCLKYEILQMLKQGSGGAIVNMSSIAGHMGSAGAGVYCASKHGVRALTKSAALEYARCGIRVNDVCPAVIETPMADRLFDEPEANQYALSLHPVGRFGKAEEIAEGVLWMCSERASYMTGQSLTLDGGLLAGPNPPAEA
jgi:NAD(P)-dependent dehydrogenase (short-subunit alcohol dehydrogenase family)